MAVLKVIEVLSSSTTSWEDATKKAVAQASKTLKNIRSVYVQEQSAVGSSIGPKLNPSFVWNNESQNWEPPIPYPVDDKHYRWDEATVSWVEITEDLETIIAEMEQG